MEMHNTGMNHYKYHKYFFQSKKDGHKYCICGIIQIKNSCKCYFCKGQMKRHNALYINLTYRPFHKTLPRFAFVNRNPVRVYETDCTVYMLTGFQQGFMKRTLVE